MKPLIIVESFTKTKTIAKYLNNEYNVICSLGHINNLPKNSLGIDTETWIGTYEITNKKILDDIKKHVSQANIIYIASDPDMEGEAIAYHIRNAISGLLKNKTCYRIEFHEITKKAVKDALNNPHDINMHIVNAQESRRFVDRLVGYKLSPLLWNKFTDNTLSVGRVQSVALAMCINIYNKIQTHQIECYWIMMGYYNKTLEFKLYEDDSCKNLVKITDKLMLHSLLEKLPFDSDTFEMNMREHQSSESPSPPYTTTSLQQDAYHQHRFSSKKTMQLAQNLYENGHITYMRTDSTHISDHFKNIIITYINSSYSAGLAQFRSYKNKIANAQEAHEAIRITNVNMLSIEEGGDIDKLYKLIWKRTVSSQMINGEYMNLDVILSYTCTNHKFIHKKAFLINPGYLTVYGIKPDDNIAIKSYKTLFADLRPSKFTCESSVNNPPSLYNEISLIKALEKEGIGRPSTYASIVDKILVKKYVEKGKNPQQELPVINYIKTKKDGIQEIKDVVKIGGSAKDLLVPTTLGLHVIEYLQTIVPFLLDIKFTSKMEAALDRICENVMNKSDVLNDFYKNHLLSVLPTTTVTTKNELKTGIIKSKYGYCYYDAKKKKYTNIESYLQWRQITVDQMHQKDIDFIASLPKKLKDGYELHIGQYGLYLKDQNKKNLKLDKSKWNDYI
jgi:DNA topoisomerase-1